MSVQWATGNSREAWDMRFTGGEWDEVHGDQLTARFAECILGAMDDEAWEFCSRPGVRILDWGCARGQLVDAFRRRFPGAVVDGLDHSQPGIEQARELFPDSEAGRMIWRADGSIPEPYDVIVTSNVLEHLLEPVKIVRSHLPFVRQYYLILVPFEEDLGGQDRERMSPEERHGHGHTHVQKFTASSFPVQIGEFARIQLHTNVVPGDIWPGRQMLVVYHKRP